MQLRLTRYEGKHPVVTDRDEFNSVEAIMASRELTVTQADVMGVMNGEVIQTVTDLLVLHLSTGIM